MVDSNVVSTQNSELENRLDDLFGANDVPLPAAPEKELDEPYPLAELKNLILSIDWEITDEVLEKLIQQLKDLQLIYKNDKIVLTFLQILNSLGNYIKTQRAKAHPKTFKILNSVFASLDKVVLAREMPESAKTKILRTEMGCYKELRKQIAMGKNAAVAAPERSQTKPPITETVEIPVENQELVIKLDEPAAGPASGQKQDAFALEPEDPSGDPAVKKKHDEPELLLDLPSETAAQSAAGASSAAAAESEPNAAPATLVEAVEEIKRYIQIEIKALKEEIHSLKEQDSA